MFRLSGFRRCCRGLPLSAPRWEGKRRKRSRQGRWLLAHREEVIAELSAQIADGSYTIAGGYRERTIIEGGKERRIQVLTMKDRIAVHAIMSIVDEHLKRRFIRTTSASIKGRGSHDLKAYIERNIREHPEETQSFSTHNV